MLLQLARFAVWLRHPRAGHVLVACGVLVGLLLAAGTVLVTLMARQDDIADAEWDLRNLSLVLAEEIGRGFEAAEIVQLNLLHALRERGIDTPEKFAALQQSAQMKAELQMRIEGLPHIGALTLTDDQGRVISSSQAWPVPDIAEPNRQHFRTLSTHPEQGPVLSAPMRSRSNGAWIVLLTRAFTTAAGQLLGTVNIQMELATFEQLFSTLSVRADSSVALFRDDGVLLARYPHPDSQIGQNFKPSNEIPEALAVPDHVARRIGLIDGRERLIAQHDVARFPLVVTVTASMQAVLAQWRMLVFWLGGAAILIELLLSAGIALGVRQLRAQERLTAAYAATIEAESELAIAREREQREHAAHLQSLRFDTALNNMVQGVLMFDGERRLVVVNPRAEALCGLPAGSLYPGMSYAEFAATAMQGNIPRQDMIAITARRAEMVEHQVRKSFIWEISDGRAYATTHQPMEEGWIATYEDITERRLLDARLDHMARHDALTDLPNRAFFRERLEHAMAFARRGRRLALLCLDLDQFKAVNDTLGHPIGDALLQAVAQRLQSATRETDTLARLGGDEFAIIQTALDKPTEAIGLATRLIEMLERPFEVSGHQIVIGTSIGISFAPEDSTDADVLLKNADLALYRAKIDGRGLYRLFHAAMDAEMQARRIMEIELRGALPSGQLELHYQPLIDLRHRSVSGFEALLRWHHPTRGLVGPAEFIPIAEDIGLIVAIGEWALREACIEAAAWPTDMRVSVNLSAVQFKNPNLVTAVAGALSESGLGPGRLELEITETIMLQDTTATIETLHELHRLGVHIAMDDFGTGYSSLSYLRRFPFDRIKIDQSFVREIGRQRDCNAIVRAILALSHELGIATTAEGVETREQLCALALAGCSDIQGFLFSRPVPAAHIPMLLRTLPDVTELMTQANLAA